MTMTSLRSRIFLQLIRIAPFPTILPLTQSATAAANLSGASTSNKAGGLVVGELLPKDLPAMNQDEIQ